MCVLETTLVTIHPTWLATSEPIQPNGCSRLQISGVWYILCREMRSKENLQFRLMCCPNTLNSLVWTNMNQGERHSVNVCRIIILLAQIKIFQHVRASHALTYFFHNRSACKPSAESLNAHSFHWWLSPCPVLSALMSRSRWASSAFQISCFFASRGDRYFACARHHRSTC